MIKRSFFVTLVLGFAFLFSPAFVHAEDTSNIMVIYEDPEVYISGASVTGSQLNVDGSYSAGTKQNICDIEFGPYWQSYAYTPVESLYEILGTGISGSDISDFSEVTQNGRSGECGDFREWSYRFSASFDASSLLPNTEYSIRIDIRNSNNEWAHDIYPFTTPGTPPPDPIYGCTDPAATNYNASATDDDNSCTYPPGAVYGCTDSDADNYNASATVDDGSCTYPPPPPPPPPSAPTLTTVCSNWPNPKVDWNFNDVGATNYQVQKWHVYYYYDLRTGTYDQTYGRADENPLADGTDNWYRVVASNAAGSTLSNETYHAVTKANCGGGTLSTGVSPVGGGTVTGTGGLSCSSATCTQDYNVASAPLISLSANPAPGYAFTGWSGGVCAGQGSSCSFQMTGDATAYATFAPYSYLLTVGISGSGTVSGNGISCPGTCSKYFDYPTEVTLTATPGTGYHFVGWTDACSGAGSCTMTMNSAKSVTATFSPNTYAVGVAIAGGSGSISGSGLNCPGTCQANYTYGDPSIFTATPSAGYAFDHWTGACDNQGATCTLLVNGDKAAYAYFSANSYTLTVAKDGTGTGTVTSSPSGINCGATCSAAYTYGTDVTLTPSPDAGSSFSGWAGACTGAGACVVSMTSAKSVTATFNLANYSLTATVNGSGSGNVTGGGMSCPGVCSANHTYGSAVQLSANPASGSTFAGWSDACSGTGGCTVYMSTNKSVTATFSLIPFNYSLSNSGAVSVTKTSGDAFGQNTITKTLVAGSSQSVSLSLSGVPSGVTYGVSNSTCSPTCTSTITFTVGSSAPVGSYTITVTGSPLSKTTSFTLSITGAPITVSCQATPSSVLLGRTVAWSSSIVGGVAPLTYEWSGTNIATPGPTTASFSKTYSTVGPKTAQLTVTDADGVTSTCPAATVQVNFDPNFEEF